MAVDFISGFFLASVPMYQKTGKIQIFGYVSGSEENPKAGKQISDDHLEKTISGSGSCRDSDRNTDLDSRIAENGRIFCGDLRSNRFVLRSQTVSEDSKDREKCCMAAEKRLQRLSRNYGEKEQQRRIELLLAWNAELLCEPEKAALYYENLLLYDAEYPVAYGEYGMFLIRTGQKEASRKLWEDYKKKEKAELLDDSESRNLQLWEEINEKKKRK